MKWGGAFLLAALSGPLAAQLPAVEWLKEQALGERPPGVGYIWNPGTLQYDYPTIPSSLTVPQAESGIDWFNDVCVVRNANGAQIGYAVAGYSFIPNYIGTDGICTSVPNGQPYPPDPTALETFAYRKGTITGIVAYYDLLGQRQWYHTYLVGSLHGIIQDKNGDLVVTGFSYQRAPWAGMPGSAQPFYYNPVSGQQPFDVADLGCEDNNRKMVLMKVDLIDGHALWTHVYGLENDPEVGVPVETGGFSVVEVDPDLPEGGGYRVVGYRKGLVGQNTSIRNRPFMVDVDIDGMLNWNQVMNASHPTGLWDDDNPDAFAFRIVRHPDPTVDQYLITGVRYQNPGDNVGGGFSAYLLYYDDNSTGPAWWEDTRLNMTEYGFAQSNWSTASRACFAVNGGNTSIIWPVLDMQGAWYAEPNHQATGRVYNLDLSGNQLWSTYVNLGPMRGFDLQLSANQRANGNLVVGCTKSSQTTSPLTTWNDVPQSIQTCLTTTYGYDPNNDPNTAPAPYNWAGGDMSVWGHWLSDSYMAELDMSNNGAVVWEGTWDADAVLGNPHNCTPDNFRQRQCSFNVIEADDGGLVSCGNTGKNVEDGYIVKFSGCESDPTRYAAFHATHPYSQSNVYTVNGSSETWSTSMAVRGSFVVGPGKTLNINSNAVISFADSRRIGYTTNIVVQPGGTLNVTGGARLTNIAPCGDGMWDGIKALGNQNLAQGPSAQATINVNTGAVIENAFVAVLAANADIYDPIGSTATQRGARVICQSGATFRDNIYDVVLRPYFCASGSGCTGETTVTKFHQCLFETTGPLNYADKTPKIHLYINTQPRIWVRGCTFQNNSLAITANTVADWGIGIQSFQTDLRIEGLNGDLPHFNTLQAGCLAANANAKTVRVNGAYFDGCGHSLGIWNAQPAHVISCDFKEPDLDMLGQGLGAPVYGSYLEATPVITFEDNGFQTSPTNNDYACVGSTFKNIGATSNTYRDNRYDGFDCLNCVGTESAGTTIQGLNAGLKFKCNQYSGTYANAYDIAFTGGGVTVAANQGTGSPNPDPAGNTFALNCATGSEQHLFNDGGTMGINIFTYYHNTPQPGVVELVPTCMSAPLTVSINQNTNVFYAGCAGPQNMMASTPANQAARVAEAHQEFVLLREVYNNWTDGGNTEGLEHFVNDAANDSYHVRNQLMLVAPKVSSEIWKLAFHREPAMNPWHLAQALIANSPLEREVLVMMENSALTPYYKQLVANEQDGVNMLSIMESELDYWRDEQTKALMAYTAAAMEEEPAVPFADAINLHAQYPVEGSDQVVLGLRLANNDLQGARSQVNTKLQGPHDSWWDVQDLWIATLESGTSPDEVTNADRNDLQAIAGDGGGGAAAASAWLSALGTSLRPGVQLPSRTRSYHATDDHNGQALPDVLVRVLPNPTAGEVVVAYTLPEGMEGAAITLFDATGREVWRKAMTRSSGLEDLPASLLLPGMYQVVLGADGYTIGTAKLIVTR